MDDRENIWYKLDHVAQSFKVTIDGEDVTNDCTEADTEHGYVVLLTRGLARDYRELRRGQVVISGYVDLEKLIERRRAIRPTT